MNVNTRSDINGRMAVVAAEEEVAEVYGLPLPAVAEPVAQRDPLLVAA